MLPKCLNNNRMCNWLDKYWFTQHNITETWCYLFTIESTSCVLSAWQDGKTKTEDPEDPLVSSFSFWHWLLDICQHLILYYSINNPRLSLLLAPNLLWQLIMLQVLGSLQFFLLSLFLFRHKIQNFCWLNAPLYNVYPVTTCVLIIEVTHSPSVLVSCALINVFMVRSNCRYLQQLGPSVIFFLWHPRT